MARSSLAKLMIKLVTSSSLRLWHTWIPILSTVRSLGGCTSKWSTHVSSPRFTPSSWKRVKISLKFRTSTTATWLVSSNHGFQQTSQPLVIKSTLTASLMLRICQWKLRAVQLSKTCMRTVDLTLSHMPARNWIVRTLIVVTTNFSCL